MAAVPSTQDTRRPVRRTFLPALAVIMALLVASCSGGSDEDDGPTVITAPEGFDAGEFDELEGLGLATSGREGCVDPADDVGSSTRAVVPPVVVQPHVDLLEAEALLPEEGEFTLRFVVVGDIRNDAGTEFLVQVGTMEDPEGFDLKIKFGEGVWSLQSEPRTVGIGAARLVRSARVTVTGNEVAVSVSPAEIPSFRAGQGLLFGVTSYMVDAEGAYLDREGGEVEKKDAIRVFDDCL